MRTRNDDINQLINIKLKALNSQPQQHQRELALSERPLVWLVERHAELLERTPKGRAFALATRMELESIEDELIDREDIGQLEYSMRFENDLWQRVKQIIQRGSNR